MASAVSGQGKSNNIGRPPKHGISVADTMQIADTRQSAGYYFVDRVMMGLSALASFARQAMMTIRKHLHSTGAGVSLYNWHSKPETNCYPNFRN